MMFSKRLAGIGAVAALVGSALVPSVAFAADPSPAPTTMEPAAVTVTKNVVANDQIDRASDTFSFTASPAACDQGEDGCKAHNIAMTIPSLTPGAALTATTTSNFMPQLSAYSDPGIYQWTVTEVQSGAADGHVVNYSGAQYRVKAYIVKNATSGALEYRAVTIVKEKNDAGTDLDPVVKVDEMTFENVYEDVTTFEVEKKVVNNAGQPEADLYDFEVLFEWPENFDGSSWTTHTPNISGGTGVTCTADTTAKTTSCSFKLAKDGKVTFSNVPVGAKHTVTETVDSDYNYSASANNGQEGTVTATAADNKVTITNTYEDVPPTGIILAAMPYVLMIGIPLLAIAGYIALRRKMNL